MKNITMDFIEALLKSKRMDTIIVIVDRFTKYAHFIALSHPLSAQKVTHILKLFL
jgi:hypothetical protein